MSSLTCGAILLFASGVPVINEFVVRPAGGEGEWVELMNPGKTRTSLGGWGIRAIVQQAFDPPNRH